MEMDLLQSTQVQRFTSMLIRMETINKSVILSLYFLGAPSTSNETIEQSIAICTNDNRLLTLKDTGNQSNPQVQLTSYDSEDGSVSQSFTLNFVPIVKYLNCNDNYLALVDPVGNVHIYKYSHSLPVWLIIFIVGGSLLIVGTIVGLLIYKRRLSKK